MRNARNNSKVFADAKVFALVLLAIALTAGNTNGAIVALQSDEMYLRGTAVQYNPNYAVNTTDTDAASVTVSGSNTDPSSVQGAYYGSYSMYQGKKYYARIYQVGTVNRAYGTIQRSADPSVAFRNYMYTTGTGDYESATFVFNPGMDNIGDPLDVTVSISATGIIKHDSEVAHNPAGAGQAVAEASGHYALNWDGDSGKLYANPFGSYVRVVDNGASEPFSITDSVTFFARVGDTMTIRWYNYLLAQVQSGDPYVIGSAQVIQDAFEVRIHTAIGQEPIPLPGTMFLMVMGLGGLAFARRKLRK